MVSLVCDDRLVPATTLDQIEGNDDLQHVGLSVSGGWDHGATSSRLRTLHADGRE